jgi:dCTP diphosphatase
MDDQGTTVMALREMMRGFVKEREWGRYHVPKNLTAALVVEAGELLELFQWLTPEEAKERCANDAAFKNAVGEEMADVLMYLLSLANAIDLDVAAAVEAKMEKNRRKYPPEKFKGKYERPLPE